MKEVYKIYNTSPDLQQNMLIKYNWLSDTLYHLASTDKWKRRSNLKGIQFDALAIPLNPYVMYQNVTNENGKVSGNQFTGMFIEVVNILGTRLNFTINKTLTQRYDCTNCIKS